MFIDQGHPVRKILKFTKVASSTWYKKQTSASNTATEEKRRGRPRQVNCDSSGKDVSDKDIISNLKELREKKFLKQTGYRKLTHFLRRDFNLIINHKKVYRLYTEAGLTLPRKKKTKRQGKRICENRTVIEPNQLWQFDIKYGYIDGENRFFFLMAFIDTFDRKIKGYHIGLRCTAKDILFALELALEQPGVNPTSLVIRSDNGTQMTSNIFKKQINAMGLEHEFTPPATPNLNAYIESFFSSVDRELFQGRAYDSYSEAYGEVVEFIKFYNEERPHSSLKMMTPNEFTKLFEKDREVEPALVA